MRLIRQTLGCGVQWIERLCPTQSPPKPLLGLVLYHYPACPFSFKVRRALRRLGGALELRDIDSNPAWRRELVEQGGKSQVPCLRITADGQHRWLFESDAIIEFLQQRIAALSSAEETQV